MTDPAAQLRDLVQQLAQPHQVPVTQQGQLLGHRQQRGLLTILADASAPTIGSGGRGGAFGPRMSFDPAASELHTAVRSRIRTWADTAGVPKHWSFATTDPIDWRDAARLLTAWHARTLHTDPRQWIPTLQGWIDAISDLVIDPPRRSTLDAPCPRCGQRWAEIVIDDADPDYVQVERIDALQVTLRDPTSDTDATCRSCSTVWTGLHGLATLQDEIHHAEHAARGISCAGHASLGPLHVLAVRIPTLERALRVTACHCDGPPHQYDPAWCGIGRGDNGRPIGGIEEAFVGALGREARALVAALLKAHR